MEEKMLYKDASQPVEARVEDLLSRMTLEEKAAQLCGDLAASFIVDGKLSHEALVEKFKDGHGRITQYSLVGLVSPKQIAEITNQLQDFFVNETRLGIPVALQSENLCGYPGAGGTLFPAQINVGATWEPELAEEMSSIIGQESRAVGITSAMSPVIDVSRDPRWGRTYETYGEDQYLISQMGIHYVRGMQNQGVSCIAKHFLGYAETQAGLNTATTRLNDRELYEVFATPFEAADKEAGLDAMMANYAEIDGLPVIDNKKIARDLLRDQMEFEGMLTSDGAAVLKSYNYFKVADSYYEAGLLAKKAGCDTEIPVGASFRNLPNYVKSGELDEALLDESVRRILTIKFKRGLFENPYCEIEKLEEALMNTEKEKVSRKIAQESLVLLKNDGILPLKKGTKVAVIGPHADSLRYPVSGYTYPAYIEMMDAARKKNADVSFNGIIDEQAKAEAEEKTPKGPFDTMFEMLDQEKLLETVAATGKPIVIVLYGPGIFSVNWAVEHVSGIIQAWMPGPFAGEVVANVLDGTANPGGKLNVTVPRSAGQIPIFYNHKNGSGYASGSDATSATIFSGGYTDGPGTPLYPFGYGLSYTEFKVENLKIGEKEVPTDGKIEVSCSVSNTGKAAGDEVVQLYQSFHGAHVVRPNKQLSGFKRVHLKPGETKQLMFHLDTAQLGYYNEEMEFVVEPGQLDIMVGTSSEDLPLKDTVTLTGKKNNVAGRRSYTCQVEEA